MATVVAATTLSLLTPAGAADTPTALSNPGNYRLTVSLSTKADADRLGNAIGASKKRDVAWIMNNANRNMASMSCQSAADKALYYLASNSGFSYGFCWKEEGLSTDDPSGDWTPQGITSTADALGSDFYDGVQAVAVTWYHKNEAHPDQEYARLTLAPIYGDGTGNDKYRHLLFVTPTDSGSDFAVSPCHAGGAMWYGNLLYVACTDQIHIYSWDHVYSADTSDACQASVGYLDTTRYCASGYAYVMMRVGSIWATGGNIRFSSISLDREATPDKLVVSEYSLDSPGKLLRFDLNATTRLPSTNVAADGWSYPFTSVQGATTRDNKFWFNSSHGAIKNGDSIQNHYGTLRFWDKNNPNVVTPRISAYGAEAICFFGDDSANPDTIFTVSEYPEYRGVIAVRASDFD